MSKINAARMQSEQRQRSLKSRRGSDSALMHIQLLLVFSGLGFFRRRRRCVRYFH